MELPEEELPPGGGEVQVLLGLCSLLLQALLAFAP